MIRASTTTTAASSSSRGHNVFYKDALTHPRAVTRRQLAPTAKADVCTTALLRLVERPQKMSHREPKYPGITSAEALLSVTSHLCSMGHPVRLCTGGVAGLATAIVVFLNVPQCPLPYNVTASDALEAFDDDSLEPYDVRNYTRVLADAVRNALPSKNTSVCVDEHQCLRVCTINCVELYLVPALPTEDPSRCLVPFSNHPTLWRADPVSPDENLFPLLEQFFPDIQQLTQVVSTLAVRRHWTIPLSVIANSAVDATLAPFLSFQERSHVDRRVARCPVRYSRPCHWNELEHLWHDHSALHTRFRFLVNSLAEQLSGAHIRHVTVPARMQSTSQKAAGVLPRHTDHQDTLADIRHIQSLMDYYDHCEITDHVTFNRSVDALYTVLTAHHSIASPQRVSATVCRSHHSHIVPHSCLSSSHD